MGSDIRSLFPNGIAKHVETLITDGRIGICAGTLRLLDYGSSCATVEKGKCADRFKLMIPYGGQSVTWEILFNYQDPDEPPDFIFGPEDSSFLPNIEDIQSLHNWNPENNASLLNTVSDMLEAYKQYQEKLIDKMSRLKFEYTSLLETSYDEKDIEIYVNRKGERPTGPVNFLIKLPIDFSKIPPYLTKDNPGEDTAVLLVTFQTPDGAKVIPQLFLSPRVENCLGGSAGLRIPAYLNGGCLIDYVPQVCELLRNKVEQVVNGFDKRKEYISAFLSYFGRSVVEYDTEAFTKITFLMEWHDFSFVVSIDLPVMFPVEQPVFTFQSVYHESHDGKPFSHVVKDYPYSPRWSGNEMAERARKYFLEYVTVFQRSSVKDGSLS